MRMLRTDLADVTGYTFLVNGQPAASPWHGEFLLATPCGCALTPVRFLCGFPVWMWCDGQVKPVTVQEFRIGTAKQITMCWSAPAVCWKRNPLIAVALSR